MFLLYVIYKHGFFVKFLIDTFQLLLYTKVSKGKYPD